MARNSSGTYTLPVSAYVANTTIRSADMNSNLSDIATALTQSLATTGVSSMTGPIKLAAGSLAAPMLTLASDTTTGWYNSAAGAWTYVTNGATIMTLGPSAATIGTLTVTNLTVTGSFSVAANRIVGEIVDYGGTSAPSLWLLCFGQAISRTTFSALFAAIGTAFGVGDGATTFNVPDLRGRVTIGKDDMGGSAANRITVGNSGITGTTLGSTGGSEIITLTQAQIPSHNHGVTDGGHTHSLPNYLTLAGNNAQGGAAVLGVTTGTTGSTVTNITIQNTGGGGSHINVQPGIITNKIIYAAV